MTAGCYAEGVRIWLALGVCGLALAQPKTTYTRGINGENVPSVQVEERVLEQDGAHKVTETVKRIYDSAGRLTSTEKLVREERNTVTGGQVEETLSRSDLNGPMRLDERRSTTITRSGPQTSADTVVARRSMDGSFQPDERRSKVTETSGPDDKPTARQVTEMIYRRDNNGRFVEAQRNEVSESISGDRTERKTSTFAPGVNGKMQLMRQTVGAESPEGSETTVYDRIVSGRAENASGPLQLKEQIILTRQPGAGGLTVETTRVRRPSLAEPNRLGPSVVISEASCKGPCTETVEPAPLP